MLNTAASRIKFAALFGLTIAAAAGLYSRLMGNLSAAPQKAASSLLSSIAATMSSSSSSSAAAAANMSTGSPHYVIQPSEKHTGTVIFLHGLGDNGQGWSVVLQEASALPYLKFVCPNAAPMSVTLNAGFRMPSWFDIYSLSLGGREDAAGIKRATQLVHKIIDDEIAASGLPSTRIALGGFSQGGALAIHAALQYPKKLAAIVGLSCWVPLHKEMQTPEAIKGANTNTPIFQAHGDSDYTVPKQFGDMSAAYIKSINPNNSTYKIYRNLAHSSSDEEMRDLKKFLEQNLPRQ